MKDSIAGLVSEVLSFFVAAYILMLVWGALGLQLGFFTITYWQSCLILVGYSFLNRRSLGLLDKINKGGLDGH